MTVIAERLFEREMPDGTYVRATATLEHLDGNTRPHFSLTGEEWKSKRHFDRGWENAGLLGCGQMPDEILEAWPELAVVERLHLADDEGVPMHAFENGWYWYSDYDGKGTHLYPHQEPMYSMTPHERAAKYLRVSPEELPEGLAREEFAEYVETLRPRWKVEADEGRAFLEAGAS